MKLFDRNGQPVEVPDEHVAAALSSGQYGAPAGTRIPVRLNGEIGTIPVENFSQAVAGGAEVIPQADYEKAELQAKYGDVKHQAIAAGAAAADTATLGLSNAAIRGIGGVEAARTVRKSQEANPISTGIGTAAGIVAPIIADVATGGAGTPEVAAAAERALARAGEKALVESGEKAAAKAVAGRVSIDTAAGLAERAPQAEQALNIQRGIHLNPGELAQGAAENPIRIAPPTEQQLFTDATQPAFARQPLPERLGPAPATPAFSIGQDSVRLGDVEAKSVDAVKNAIQVHAPVPPEVAEGAARVAVEEASPTVRQYGKGVVRQTVETSLFGSTRLVQGAGDIVEREVARIVGKEAETAIGRIAQKAVAQTARGAAEGGVYGVGNEIGHQFLQEDPDLSGERLATAWFNGALLGGALGGGLSVVGSGAKEALSRAVGNEGISQYLSKKAGEHMWHAAGPTKAMTAQAEKYAGGAAKVGNLIREDAMSLMGRTPRSREELLELAGLMQEKHAGEIESVFQRLDDKTHGATRLRLDEVLKPIEKIERELQGRAADSAPITKFKNDLIDALDARNKTTGEINGNAEMSFKQLRDFRRTVDEKAKFNSTVENAVRDKFKELRNDFEKRIEAVADKHLATAGLTKDYKAAKAGYQAGKLLEKAAEKGVAGEKTNQFLSLTDKLMEIPGAMVGEAVAGPVGSLITGIATGHASKFIRKNFDFVVSDTLAKLADVTRGEHVLTAAQKTSEKAQKRADQAASALRKGLDGGEVPERAPISGPRTFAERRDKILNIAAQHQAVAEHLQNVTTPLDRAAPNVANSLKSAALRTVIYLTNELPKPPPPKPGDLTPQIDAKRWEPSPPEQAAWNRKWDMAVHPEHALSLVATGEYTIQHDQALAALHPKQKAKMQDTVQKMLSERTKPVPVGIRPSIRLFLGVPQVDPGLAKMMQANYDQPKPQKTPNRPLKLADTTSLNAPKY